MSNWQLDGVCIWAENDSHNFRMHTDAKNACFGTNSYPMEREILRSTSEAITFVYDPIDMQLDPRVHIWVWP